MAQPSLAIVILHYGEQDRTVNCARSVHNAIWAAGDACVAQVYLVDNSAAVDPFKFPEGEPENTKIIRSDSNLGFASGMNLGIHAALQDNFDYLWLLNNDTIVDESAISTLIKHAKCHPEQKWIGCTMMNPSTNRVATIGGYQYSAMLSAARPIKEPGTKPDYIDGAAMLLCAKTADRLGGIPHHNFMYFEELYLARALQNEGLAWGVCEAAIIWHIGGAGTAKLSLDEKTYYLTTAALGYTSRYAKAFVITVWATRLIKAVFDSGAVLNSGGLKGFYRASIHHFFRRSNS